MWMRKWRGEIVPSCGVEMFPGSHLPEWISNLSQKWGISSALGDGSYGENSHPGAPYLKSEVCIIWKLLERISKSLYFLRQLFLRRYIIKKERTRNRGWRQSPGLRPIAGSVCIIKQITFHTTSLSFPIYNIREWSFTSWSPCSGSCGQLKIPSSWGAQNIFMSSFS